MVVVRTLDGTSAEVYQTLWLSALRQHPEAFGASLEEEAAVTTEKRAVQLNNSSPDDVTFGAFEGEQLVGIAKFIRYARPKMRHRAMISGMYVLPEARGCGAGKALLKAVIQYATAQTGLEDLVLAVTVGNDAARNLYLKSGFQPYSVDPRFLKVGDLFYDIEWMIRSNQS